MEKHITYTTQNTCSKQIDFDYIDGKVYNLKFKGGCPGNLSLLCKILEGKTKEEILKLIGHVECGTRGTSCSIELSKALNEIE